MGWGICPRWPVKNLHPSRKIILILVSTPAVQPDVKSQYFQSKTGCLPAIFGPPQAVGVWEIDGESLLLEVTWDLYLTVPKSAATYTVVEQRTQLKVHQI